MSRPTLLQAQTNALLTLLNLNQTPPSASSSSDPYPRPKSPSSFDENIHGPLVWKVLILDELSKDVLATSLRVQDLREQGVTLHMWVTSMSHGNVADTDVKGNYMHRDRLSRMSLLCISCHRPWLISSV